MIRAQLLLDEAIREIDNERVVIGVQQQQQIQPQKDGKE
jgi:hypothetical protein